MWTRDDAVLLYRALLHPVAEKHGFSAALYGSVLASGEGNDLDVFMIPQREDPDTTGLVNALRRHMQEVSDPRAGEWNRDVAVATTMDGKHIDIQFTRL
jgi:hypothetical protein